MSSLDLRDHDTQPAQIRQPTVGPPTREGDERIGLGDIGPRDGHGGQRAVISGVEDAVLPPGLVHGHDVERASGQRVKRVGDPEDLMRSTRINGS